MKLSAVYQNRHQLLVLKKAGFTLVETLMSLAILAIIMIGFITATTQSTKNNEKVAIDSTESLNSQLTQSIQQDFLNQASPSFYFLHIPISSACLSENDLDTPCIRTLHSANGEFKGLTNIQKYNLPQTIEFYKDVSGELKEETLSGFVTNRIDNTAAQVNIVKNVTYEKRSIASITTEEIPYASWSFKNENSPALPMLTHRKKMPTLIQHPNLGKFANENPHNFTIVEAPGIDLTAKHYQPSQFQDTLFVVHNPSHPTQFVLKRVDSIVFCGATEHNRNFCLDKFKSVNTVSDFLTYNINKMKSFALISISNIPLDSTLISNASPGVRTHLVSQFIPTQLSVKLSQERWPAATGSQDYLFPRLSVPLILNNSISNVIKDDAELDLLKNDPKSLKHFYTILSYSEAVIAFLPVELSYIKLQKNPSKSHELDLVVKSTSFADLVLVPSVIDTKEDEKNKTQTRLFFNRRLGSGSIEIFTK